MRDEFKQADRVVLRGVNTAINRHLEVGDRGVIIREERPNGQVAVMFDREFSGGIGYTPHSNSDAILIEKGYVVGGQHVGRRCEWIPVELLRKEGGIKWIE